MYCPEAKVIMKTGIIRYIIKLLPSRYASRSNIRYKRKRNPGHHGWCPEKMEQCNWYCRLEEMGFEREVENEISAWANLSLRCFLVSTWRCQVDTWIYKPALEGSGLSQWLRGKRIHLQGKSHRRCGFNPWVRKIFWRRAWQPTPVFLPGESRGQKSLAGYSPQGRKVLDMTEAT